MLLRVWGVLGVGSWGSRGCEGSVGAGGGFLAWACRM